MEVKMISWNVAGIRAVIKKGLWNYMEKEKADIYCLQEVKAKVDQIPKEWPNDFNFYLNSAERPGYSGVATFSKLEAKNVIAGNRDNDWDDEGRVLITKFDEFTLLNVYFPNGKRDRGRLAYKMEFYDYFLKYINNLREQGEKVIFCGDVNTAHQEIDLARPKENQTISGFLPEERAWLDKLVKNRWVDTYRYIHGNEVAYSWWSNLGGARKRNVGWRIDYFFVDESLKDKVTDAFILTDVMGSDHCPVGIKINI